MAMLAATVWEIRTAGNDLNGGGFLTGAAGVDFSQQDAKNTVGNNISTTDVVTNGTTTITSATASFTADMVGNVIYLQGGTGAVVASRYRVVTFTNGTTVVLDRSTGLTAGTGVTMNIGGALASIGIAFSSTATIPVAGNKFYIKAGTYSVTTATQNVSAGVVNTGLGVYIKGYQTTREDMGTPPLIQATGGINTFNMFNLSSAAQPMIKNVSVDCAGGALTRAFAVGGSSAAIVWRCRAANCTNNGFQSNSIGSQIVLCSATGCSTNPAFNCTNMYGCVAFSNTISGFLSNTGTRCVWVRCISYANSGAASDGFESAGNQGSFFNCVAFNNGRSGFRLTSGQVFLQNCIAQGHAAGFGFTHVSNEQGLVLQSCAGFDNASGNVSLGTGSFNQNNDFVTGTGSFFTNAAAGDFSLNNTAGAGAAARAVGQPGVFPEGLTTGFLDIGAAQHQDGGGGGGGEHSAVF